MKIWTLIENTACRQDLTAEHGLSLYIALEDKKLLFDMGQSSAFAANAQTLGLSLGDVSVAVLSHGHYDHGGGLGRFWELAPQAAVYVSQYAFQPHYHGPERYIGLDPALAEDPRLVCIRERQQLFPGATLFPDLPCPHPIAPGGLTVQEAGVFQPEDFRHEQYLLLEEKGKRVLISGCSHRGIVNIAEHFRPDVLIGGFHLMKVTDREQLQETAQALAALPTRYYTGHCTGAEQFRILKEVLEDRLEGICAGRMIEL